MVTSNQGNLDIKNLMFEWNILTDLTRFFLFFVFRPMLIARITHSAASMDASMLATSEVSSSKLNIENNVLKMLVCVSSPVVPNFSGARTT